MLRQNTSTYISRNTACSLARAIAFCLMLALAPSSFAQTGKTGRLGQGQQRLSKEEQLRLRQKEIDDSIPLWRGFQVKADLLGAVERGVSSYGQYEAGLRINLKDKYFPVIELGYGSADENNDVTQIHYKTSAPYGRIGLDFNVMKNKHDIYRLYAGLRYAYTSFKYDVDHSPLIDPVWGGETPFAGHDVKANYSWAEAVVGIDAKIFGPVHLGWTIRYRRRLSHDEGELGNVWYVPGYGKQGGSRIGGSFEIMFEL